jgi:hypothetical protein
MTRSPLDLKAATTSTWQGLIERKEQSTGIFTVGMNTHFPLSHIARRQSDMPNHATLLTSSGLRAEDCNPSAKLPGLFEAQRPITADYSRLILIDVLTSNLILRRSSQPCAQRIQLALGVNRLHDS